MTVNPRFAFTNHMNDWYAIAVREVANANAFLVKLADAASGITPPTINPVFPSTPTTPPLEATTPPTMQPIVWTLPGMPGEFTGSLDIGDYMPEPFDTDPPVLSFATAPAPFSDALPDAPGVNLSFDDPTLDFTLPAPPSLLSIQTYRFDGVTIPSLVMEVPELSLVAPAITPYNPGQFYASRLLSASQSALERFIEQGGTGLAPEVEEALWNRARQREYRAMSDAVADLDKMEAMGFSLPPGVYVDARLKITTEMGYAATTLSRDITIEQAKLEQQNVQESLKNAIQLESALVQYNNQVEQRAFDAAKYATEAGVEIYNARVRAYAAYLDAYKTKVAIYEAQIRGELGKVEAYKAEMEAESVKAQVNTALVQQYKTQVEAALANVEVYKAEIAAIQTKAQIEKLKIEVFGEQVRAYGSKVNAYTAGVEGFRAQIQAEGAKQEAFKAQVQAYAAQVDAGAKQAEAKIEEFKALIAAKGVEWDGYKAAATAEASKAQAISSSNQSAAEAYRAETVAISSYNEVLTKQWQVAVDQAQRVAEIGVAAAKANAELFISTRSLILEAAKVGAQVSAQIGAAALNSANYSESKSMTFSGSESDSDSYVRSLSDSNSNVNSVSRSDSNVNSVSKSDSNVNSNSNSNSNVNSRSTSDSNVNSNSTSLSNVVTDSTSRSDVNSNSNSNVNSNSNSVVTSTSDVTSKSDSNVNSVSDATIHSYSEAMSVSA
jgi:hypothetical protein